MKVPHYVLPALILASLTGCHWTNNSVIGDREGIYDNQKPAGAADTAQVDTSQKDVISIAGSEEDSTQYSKWSKFHKQDNRFLEAAYRGGLLEVELGRIAQTRATDPNIRDYGAMMVRDHAKGDDDIKAIAASGQLSLPDSVSGDQKRERDRLLNESSLVFDKDYINTMVMDHKSDINEFRNESTDGQDSTVKSFAVRTLKMLNTHLDRADYLQSKVH